jgi:hypothetical protein
MRNRVRRALRGSIASYVHSSSQPVRPPVPKDAGEVEGVIQHVDPVGRELPVLVNGASVHFYVPFQCTISINDEVVRMPYLRALDRARLSYSVEHGVLTAHTISVSPG